MDDEDYDDVKYVRYCSYIQNSTRIQENDFPTA